MYLKTEYTLPGFLRISEFKKPEDVDPNEPWADFSTVPSDLVILDEADWPEWVKAKIVECYKAIGVENPLQQKLVEPTAFAFRKRADTGEHTELINWQMVVDYFEYESASAAIGMADNDTDYKIRFDHVEALQQQALKKYGGIFSHKIAYSSGEY